jgi:LDH2 family malate/lactate/ureidoglycolate dehydrogenase
VQKRELAVSPLKEGGHGAALAIDFDYIGAALVGSIVGKRLQMTGNQRHENHTMIFMKASCTDFHMVTMTLGVLSRSVSRHPEFQFIHRNGL